MKDLTVKETAELFYSYGLKCNPQIIEDWVATGKLKGSETGKGYIINENDAYDFLYDYRWEGTAYERGIDDQTKIERLEKAIYELKDKNNKLNDKIIKLEISLGISPF